MALSALVLSAEVAVLVSNMQSASMLFELQQLVTDWQGLNYSVSGLLID